MRPQLFVSSGGAFAWGCQAERPACLRFLDAEGIAPLRRLTIVALPPTRKAVDRALEQCWLAQKISPPAVTHRRAIQEDAGWPGLAVQCLDNVV